MAVESPAVSSAYLVQRHYTRRVAIALAVIIAIWHCLNDAPATVSGVSQARAGWVLVAAWVVFAGMSLGYCWALLRRNHPARHPWPAAIALLALVGAADVAVAPSQFLTFANWAWGAMGWLAIVIFWRSPLRGLLPVLGVNALLALAALIVDRMGDRGDLARYMMVVIGTGALQIGLAGTVQALRAAATWVAQAAAAQAEAAALRAAADEVHQVRRQRYEILRRGAAELLTDLGYGNADPADPEVQRRAATEAARLRRLVVERDDVPDPLLHELRAGADIAERKGVQVDLLTVGVTPALELAVRRALTEPPIAVLAAAKTRARVTVAAARNQVAVSVVADSDLDVVPAALRADVDVDSQRDGAQLWVETRTQVPTPR